MKRNVLEAGLSVNSFRALVAKCTVLSAYRRDALMDVGGFPRDVIFGEDTVTAAKFLLPGWKIAYVAEARVYHSHIYTRRQEFKRYFDIGVLHAREGWLLKEFGSASGEGWRFVRSELRYLWPRHWCSFLHL